MSEPKITEPFLLRLQATIEANPELNVSNLSAKAGLSNSTIRHMLDKNRSPRVATMRKICAAMGTTLEAFMSSAETSEELEIAHLVSQLSVRQRRQLLGYGQALLEQKDQAPAKLPEGEE